VPSLEGPRGAVCLQVRSVSGVVPPAAGGVPPTGRVPRTAECRPLGPRGGGGSAWTWGRRAVPSAAAECLARAECRGVAGAKGRRPPWGRSAYE
jgi:hypothetical protein